MSKIYEEQAAQDWRSVPSTGGNDIKSIASSVWKCGSWEPRVLGHMKTLGERNRDDGVERRKKKGKGMELRGVKKGER